MCANIALATSRPKYLFFLHDVEILQAYLKSISFFFQSSDQDRDLDFQFIEWDFQFIQFIATT